MGVWAMPGEAESGGLGGRRCAGVWRLGWLLFMQPIKLHRLFEAWGLEADPLAHEAVAAAPSWVIRLFAPTWLGGRSGSSNHAS